MMMSLAHRLAVLDELLKECHQTARDKGFWDGQDPKTAGPTKIALMHSELSEALEEMRKPEPNVDALTEEFADVIIRVFDFCGACSLRLSDVLLEKMATNRERPRMHGKRF